LDYTTIKGFNVNKLSDLGVFKVSQPGGYERVKYWLATAIRTL